MKVLFIFLCLALASRPGSGQYFTACGGQLTEQNRVVKSPNYPGIYPNNAFCSWVITANENETIDLRFSSFDLEGISSNQPRTDTCLDYVKIFDGPTVNSPLMAVMCKIRSQAELANTIIRSTRNKMLITFVSDSSRQRPGFLARFWTHECPEFTYGTEQCNLTCNCDRSKAVNCDNINGMCICKRGWGSADCSQDVDECVNGTVEACSHNYQECINTVGSFQCECKEGLIKTSSGECEDDPAAVCQPGNTCSHLCAKVASQGHQEQCYCPDNMQLVGNTCQPCRNGVFGKDCRLTCPCIVSNTKSCDTSTGGCVCSEGWTSSDCSKDIDECSELLGRVCASPQEICINKPGGYECKPCSFNLTSLSGTIQSLNYPGNALDNTSCTWTIRAQGSQATVSFNLSVLHTICADTYRDLCCNEALEVYDGDSSSALLLGRFCGYYTNTSSIMSSSNTMHIVFRTRRGSYTKYFSGTYSTNADYHVYRQNLTATSGNITSPGYPAGDPYNIYATWKIRVAHGSAVTFRNFSYYGLRDCDIDFVEIYDGGHAGANRLGRFCGKNLPSKISSTDKSMYIVYTSLESTAAKGFNGSYVKDACKCHKYGTESCDSPTGPCVCKRGAKGTYCEQDINECQKSPCPAHSRCINTWGSFHCVCWNGSNVNSTGFCTDWAMELTNERGYFQSQEFPNQYPFHVNYTWTITGQPNRVVSLRFSQFDLEATPKCWSDIVGVYDSSDVSDRLIGQYCGKNVPGLLRTKGSKMRISFKTDGFPFDLHRGFNATYYSHVCPPFKYGAENCNLPCPCIFENTKFCDNINGFCICKPGWVGRGCSQDIDECQYPTICPRYSDCFNEAGNYHCKCHPGYTMNYETHKCEESSGCSEAMRKQCSHLCDVDVLTQQEKCYCPEDMVLSSNGVTCLANLYPHGAEAADTYIDPAQATKIGNTQVSEPIQFSSQMSVGKRPQSVAYVLYNGVILLNKNVVMGTPNLKTPHIGNQNLLAPLWPGDKCFGQTAVSYHLYETCDSPALLEPANQNISSPKQNEVIARAARDVKKYYKLIDFEVNTVLVATWTHFQSESRDNNSRSTFQTIFVNCFIPTTNVTFLKDKKESYAIFIYNDGEHACKPEPPLQVGVSTDLGVSKLQIVTTKDNLASSVGNTGDRGVVTFKVGTSLTASQMCQRYLCKKSALIENQHFKSEIDELFQCPCTLNRLGLQWEQVINHELDPKTKCYAISAVAKWKLLGQNQRNRLCCYSWTPPRTDSWTDWFQAWQAGSFTPSSHVLISDPWLSSSLFGNPRAFQDAVENMKAHKLCCRKSSFNLCNRFKKVFGDTQCTSHPTFVLAHTLGDPSISTLDHFRYPMNGWGEYIMLDIQRDNFTLQARTERVELNGILSNGTVFTAFAAREQGYARFQVQLAQTHTTMVVLADGMDFTNSFYSDPLFTRSTETFSVRRINENNRIVAAAVFPCGVSIKVHVDMKSLQIVLQADLSLQNKTRGLLGNFNGNPEDDFLLPSGAVLPSNMKERQILKMFAKEYLVTPANSVFMYDKGESTDDYQHPEYVPLFLEEAEPVKFAMAREICGHNSKACVYDYVATSSIEFALNTKREEEAIDLITQSLNNTPPTIRLVTGLSNNNHWLVKEGRENYLRLEARDADGDLISYLLSEDFTGAVLYQNGSVSYTPNIQVPTRFGIRAKDSRGEYSPVLTVIIAVCPLCSGNGNCSTGDVQVVHLEGQYQILMCSCHPAYTGANCESELDACELLPCSKGQDCTDLTAEEQGNSSVGYRCGSCPAGTTNVNGLCEDVNECLDLAMCNQECLNTYRSYSCFCRPGFRLDQADGRTCIDINECEERTSLCTQECINTEGTYTCSCKHGYTLNTDGKTCSFGGTISILCQQCEQICEVTNGAFLCDCNIGYTISESNSSRCVDVDECNKGGYSPCSQKCSNTLGHFLCSCHPGYRLDMDRVTCLECESPYFGDNCSSTCECHGRGTCDKIRGCVCDMQWSGTHCDVDVNECADSNSCARGLVCVNEPGSFSCVCPEGYQMENGVCSDIDECSDYSSTCDLNVEDCYNNIGSYSCRCKTGFAQNAATGLCADIDECASRIDGCEHICENGPGSYRCVCHQGYRLAVDRRKCEKNKEVCSICSHGCSLDDAGSPVCICPRGYRNVGGNVCEDINECLSVSKNLCSHNCTNTAGNYICSCKPGYRLENDGRKCTACSGGTWGVECNKSCSCGKGALLCDPQLGCNCKPGYTGEHCTDIIDRCANGELKCPANEECVIAGGNCVCQCHKGYMWYRGQCKDENECLNRRLHDCDQVCTNTQGSFTCSCYRGYTYNSSTNTCHDVDECQQENPCNQICVNTEGNYRCACHPGQFLQVDGVTCGSCQNGCPTTCNCVESNTNHCDRATSQCTCKEGWTSDDCSVDVDECLHNPCPGYRQCSNLNGSFECVCWNGLQIGPKGDCTDCNRTLTESTGYVMTSNYPQLYESNSHCSWTVTTNVTDAVIVFRLNDYDVEGCPFDYLEVYDGSNSQAPLLHQFCDNWQTPVKSTGNSMYLVFRSDVSEAGRGFKGSYVSELPCKNKTCSYTCNVVSSNPWTETCVCPEWKKLDTDGLTCVDINGCSAIITQPAGYIVSANYPAEYPLDFTCHWTILGNQNSIVTFSFSDFALEASADCTYDYLKLYDGSNELTPLLGNFCGMDRPPNVTSSGSTMYILFHSDSSMSYQGFHGTYSIHG